MNNLKSNIIKAIFPDEYIGNENLNDDIIEKYYKTDNICLNSFQIPDQLSNINGCHGFSKYIRDNTSTNVTTSLGGTDLYYTTPVINISYIDSVNLNEVNSYYHKIIMGKDIDWENAYLRYAKLNYDNLNKPIHYFDIDPNPNNSLKTNEGDTTAYMYYERIPERINNTYELFAIVDYLFLKVKALQFMLEKLQSQRNNMEIRKTLQEANQSNS